MEPTGQMRLQHVDLAASVGSHYLLQDISFEMFPGDRIVLVGPSGAGKTSLLRLLNRLGEATQGTIYFNHQELHQIPVIQLRRQVVLVPQESKLLGMTVEAALTYPLTLQNLPKNTITQRLQYWLDQLHIPAEWLDRTELQLSVGQRQLVAIARALMLQPQILLLDEPTSALDAGRANQVLNILTDLAERDQITLLMVNHQLDLAQQFCTRMLYLQQGQLLKDLPSQAVDWADLRHTLIQVETAVAQEWS